MKREKLEDIWRRASNLYAAAHGMTSTVRVPVGVAVELTEDIGSLIHEVKRCWHAIAELEHCPAIRMNPGDPPPIIERVPCCFNRDGSIRPARDGEPADGLALLPVGWRDAPAPPECNVPLAAPPAVIHFNPKPERHGPICNPKATDYRGSTMSARIADVTCQTCIEKFRPRNSKPASPDCPHCHGSGTVSDHRPKFGTWRCICTDPWDPWGEVADYFALRMQIHYHSCASCGWARDCAPIIGCAEQCPKHCPQCGNGDLAKVGPKSVSVVLRGEERPPKVVLSADGSRVIGTEPAFIHFMHRGRIGCKPTWDDPYGHRRTSVAREVTCPDCRPHLAEWEREQIEATEKRLEELRAKLLGPSPIKPLTITPLSCEVSEKPRLTDDGSRVMGTEVTMNVTGIVGDDGPQNCDCPEEQRTLFSDNDCCPCPTCNDCGKPSSGCACKQSAPECVCAQGHHGIHDPGCAWKRWKDQGCTT